MGDTTVDLPAIEIASRTDPGRDPSKQVNEDACDHRATRFGHLAVVCDGMGGHLGGKEASAAALAAIFEVFDDAPASARGRDVLVRAIESANAHVFAMGTVSPKDALGHSRPGSTVVALLLHPGGCEIAHVGDSRCYVVHGGKAEQLTRDHSVVQQMVSAGLLSEEAAKNHPDANRITRALGTDMDIDVELAPAPYAYVTGDVFVLCSDGLSDLVEPKDLVEIAGSQPPPQAAGALVDLANARGGHDNVTVVVVRARTSASAQGPGAGGVAPTVVQTSFGTPAMAFEPAPVLPRAPAPSRPPRARSSKLPLAAGLILAGIAIAAAVVALAVGLRSHGRAVVDAAVVVDGGGDRGAVDRQRSATPLGSNPPAMEPTPEDLPKLHHPDGSLLP